MTIESTAINIDLIDQLLKDYKSPEDVIGEKRLLKHHTKAVLECALKAKRSHYLGYEKYSPKGKNSSNARNGKSKDTLKSDFGSLLIEAPRDCHHQECLLLILPRPDISFISLLNAQKAKA
jgi:putative transposase